MLPAGFTVGHGTDLDSATGCTVILAPAAGAVGAVEVRGGGPGTRETDVLSPASPSRPIHAVVFSGGSARGLAVASEVAELLLAMGRGYRTYLGTVVPLVPAAVVYDLGLGGEAPPGPDAARAAVESATASPARGTVGAGTGCTVGNVLGREHATKGGVGLASEEVGGCTVAAIAVVNAVGDVLAEDGTVLAGPYRDGRYHRTVDALRAGVLPPLLDGEATTLVCVTTDAALDRLGAWRVARAATTGSARAIDPTATQSDGDACFVLAAGGATPPDPLVLQAVVPHVVAAAIRDAVLQATPLAGCASVASRGGG